MRIALVLASLGTGIFALLFFLSVPAACGDLAYVGVKLKMAIIDGDRMSR